MAEIKAKIFRAEFGRYFQLVSKKNPVGVCENCLALRLRSEVNPREKCALHLLNSDLDSQDFEAGSHSWKAFSERPLLESYVKDNFFKYQKIADRVREIDWA